jgi:hypothetical protein
MKARFTVNEHTDMRALFAAAASDNVSEITLCLETGASSLFSLPVGCRAVGKNVDITKFTKKPSGLVFYNSANLLSEDEREPDARLVAVSSKKLHPDRTTTVYPNNDSFYCLHVTAMDSVDKPEATLAFLSFTSDHANMVETLYWPSSISPEKMAANIDPVE